MKEDFENAPMEEQGVDNTSEKNALYTERLNLESQLSATDYKVVKCAEAVAVGLPMPYDVDGLHASRKAWRDRIAAIDAELKALDGEEPTPEERLAAAKAAKISEIEEYDISANVNAFTVDGNPMWLNFDLRQRLDKSINNCKDAEMTKYFGGVPFTYSVAAWRQMLDAVSAYADACQTVTEAHKALVQSMQTVAEVESFDITSGYPQKLAF